MYQYPHTIENGHGEQLIFKGIIERNGINYLQVENNVRPKAGPPMHVHYRQVEQLTVIEGTMAIQVLGEEPKYISKGETATFEAGVMHKFWNAGDNTLTCRGEIWPVDNIEYFLTEIFESAKNNKHGRPAGFDAAYLLNRYRSEFDMADIPTFVKKMIFPAIIFFGKLSGKHKKFANAPEPVR